MAMTTLEPAASRIPKSPLSRYPEPQGRAHGPAPATEDGAIRLPVEQVLDLLPQEIVVVGRSREIWFANGPARALFAAHRDVWIGAQGNLIFTRPAVDREFDHLLGALSQRAIGEGLVMMLSQENGRHRMVSVRALDSGAGVAVSRFLVTFSRLANTLSAEALRQVLRHFGLTPAEERLALYLGTGGCLAEAARKFRLSRHTVRNQLRAVFDKAGVRRQADLTRLVCGGAFPH